MGYLEAWKYFGAPRTPLERCVKQRRLSAAEETVDKLGRKPAFPPDLKVDPVQLCLIKTERFFGTVRPDSGHLTYLLAAANISPNIFNVKNQ
jgi:hypothetical protein